MDIRFIHPADQIVMTMERVYHAGLTTTSGGNISIKDENGSIWITPASVDKGKLTRRDIVCVKEDGSIEGIHRPSSEFPFHKMIYEARQDIQAIVHAHPPALVTFSIVRQVPNTMILPTVHKLCGDVGIARYALPGSEQLGENIADVFKEGYNNVILENHGIVVGYKDLFTAYQAFETLDFCARIEIEASKVGKLHSVKVEELKETNDHLQFEDSPITTYGLAEIEHRQEMCELIHRAYKQKLFTSSQGTFSKRLEGDSFLITPYNKDRLYLESKDIVRVDGDQIEQGKIPSRSVELHQHIYAKHPHIQSVIIAHPPSVMAYAVTDAEFDSRTIPESYILLRNIPKIEYALPYTEPEKIAQIFTKDTPLAIVENNCLIVTGTSLIDAFDRLEVAEYSAKALSWTNGLSDVYKIADDEIDELKAAFKL